jgi:hemerythrin-like metal-binding protein
MEIEIIPTKVLALDYLANITAQHLELELKLTKLKSLSLYGSDTRQYLFQLNVLIGYVSAHFATEEQLMQSFECPMLLKHKQNHSDFIKRLTNFSNDIVEGKMTNLNTVTKFIDFWFEKHDLDFDIVLESFMTRMVE